MILLYLILGVLAVGLLAAVIVQRVTLPGVQPVVTSESFQLPARGGLAPDQVSDLRFDPALRGYRMAQVDLVLSRLSDELRSRDREIEELRRTLEDLTPQ